MSVTGTFRFRHAAAGRVPTTAGFTAALQAGVLASLIAAICNTLPTNTSARRATTKSSSGNAAEIASEQITFNMIRMRQGGCQS